MNDLRKGFHDDLDSARAELVRLAASVTEAIPRATAVLLDGDLEGADYIIQGDDEIDARSLDLEEHCYRILALQAPVASDLRQVVALLRMISDVERSADLVCNICKAARRIYGHELDPKLRGIISRMGEQAQQLYTAAIESFVEHDAAKAAAIDDMPTLSASRTPTGCRSCSGTTNCCGSPTRRSFGSTGPSPLVRRTAPPPAWRRSPRSTRGLCGTTRSPRISTSATVRSNSRPASMHPLLARPRMPPSATTKPARRRG